MSNKGTITDLSLKAKPSKQDFLNHVREEDLTSPSLETVVDTDITRVEEPGSYQAVSLPCGQ